MFGKSNITGTSFSSVDFIDLFCFIFPFAAETVRLQKESAVIDAKAEEHERLLSDVKHLQVKLFRL